MDILYYGNEVKKEYEKSREGYDGFRSVTNFISLFILSIILWIVALIFLINNWGYLATWAKFLSVICLLFVPYGSIITLLLIFLFRQNYLQKFIYY